MTLIQSQFAPGPNHHVSRPAELQFAARRHCPVSRPRDTRAPSTNSTPPPAAGNAYEAAGGVAIPHSQQLRGIRGNGSAEPYVRPLSWT